jgi:hypothetical protein
MSIINLDTNDIVRMFQVRATAALKRKIDEVKWWEDRVRRGLVKREHVNGIFRHQSALSEQNDTFWAFQNFLAEYLDTVSLDPPKNRSLPDTTSRLSSSVDAHEEC